MSVKIKIKVTREMIDKSQQRCAENCAIANALRDIFPNPSVTLLSMRPFAPPGWALSDERARCMGEIIIPLPTDMRAFITEFDRTEDRSRVQPREFEIEIPDNVIEHLSGVEEVYRILENHPLLSIVSS
jgi:hypothetical protein